VVEPVKLPSYKLEYVNCKTYRTSVGVIVGVGVGVLVDTVVDVGDCVGVGVEVLEFVGVNGNWQSSSTTIVKEYAVEKVLRTVHNLLR
jgi:hypothetical protein